MGKICNLIFDWDGTLTDSANLGFHAFQQTFGELGVHFDQDVYQSIYSPNWYNMYEALGLPRDKWPTADELWIRHYGEVPARFTEGAEETLRELKSRNYRFGLVSSGTHSRVVREIADLGLASLFEIVVCNEQMTLKKPHPEGLFTAMKHMECNSSCCSYIGDSPEDIQMGKSAQVFTVGVRSEYPTSRNLPELQPDLYLEDIRGLLEHF